MLEPFVRAMIAEVVDKSVRPQYVEVREKIDGFRTERDETRREEREEREDWEHKWELIFQSALGDSQAFALGANQNAESAKRRLEIVEAQQQVSSGRLDSHLGSHRLEATEREKRLLAESQAVRQEEVKGKWSLREKALLGIIGLVTAIATALIAALSK